MKFFAEMCSDGACDLKTPPPSWLEIESSGWRGFFCDLITHYAPVLFWVTGRGSGLDFTKLLIYQANNMPSADGTIPILWDYEIKCL